MWHGRGLACAACSLEVCGPYGIAEGPATLGHPEFGKPCTKMLGRGKVLQLPAPLPDDVYA